MNDTPALPPIMTPRTVAEHWQCSERHVRNLIASGLLPHFRIGAKLIRIRGEDVAEFERQASLKPEPIPEKTIAKPLENRALTRVRLARLRGR